MPSFLTNTPDGNGAYDWSDANNWTPSSPVSGDSITLQTGTGLGGGSPSGNQATYTSIEDIANLTLNDLSVGSGVTLDITTNDLLKLNTGANLSNAGQIQVFGTFTVQNINSNTGSIIAESGGSINLTNVSSGSYVIDTGGQITISSSGNINGAPTFFLQGGLLQSLSNTPGQASVDFTGSAAGHLAINTGINGNPYNNSLDNMGVGDSIEFNDATITAVSYDSGNKVLTLTANNTNYTVNITSFDPSVTSPTFILSTDPLTGRADAEVVCFMAGTRILTPDGVRPVELLFIGDKVLTADGQVRAIRWIWRQTVVTAFADKLRVYPIRVMAGALGDNIPACDLFLSPDHAILLDGCLVQAGALVNNTTILRVARPAPRFVYYHIELDNHALILAEGVAAETFIDNVTRRRFDNYADYEATYGTEEISIVELNLPRAKSARQLPRAIRDRLAARVAALSASVRQVA